MRLFLMVLAIALAGCESDRISNCGYACHNANSRMVGYSAAEGCKCESMTPPVPCLKDGGS